jgi:protein-L-isoaspartate(D-aspartate) O-methyltransferase
MTGTAESMRQVKPDPLKPALVNGSFEEMAKDGALDVPKGWHYVRQAEVVADDKAPDGKQFVRFTNLQPGRGSQMLQAFPLDGSKIHALDVKFRAKATNIYQGQTPNEMAYCVFTFYDENQRTLDEKAIGPMRGTFDWQDERGTIRVPPKATYSIVRIGLLGAVGELSVDNISITPGK